MKSVWREPSGLVKAEVVWRDLPETIQLPDRHASLAEVLEGLLRHPQIQQLQLDSDLTDGWRVGAKPTPQLPMTTVVTPCHEEGAIS